MALAFVLVTSINAADADPILLNFTGTISNLERNISNTNSFGEPIRSYINSMGDGSTFDITFAIDEDATPDSTSSNSFTLTSVYSSSISLVEGRAGSFTGFDDWTIRFFLYSQNAIRGTNDSLVIEMFGNDGRSAYFYLNYNTPEDGWDTPFELPTAEEFNNPFSNASVLFDGRQFSRGLGRQIFYEWSGGAGFGAIIPEPTSFALLTLASAPLLRRPRC
ncbi:hypothetical protein [Mucisphaera sp.]|uniref:hypothetical protein n=1 Tax=Mucisphaera sp. TaxID=2913024 RepID=UPI003D10F871